MKKIIWYFKKCNIKSQKLAITNNKKIIYSHETGRGVFIVDNFEEVQSLKLKLLNIGVRIKGSKSHSMIDNKIIIHFNKFLDKPFQEWYDGKKSIEDVIDGVYSEKIEFKFKGATLKINVIRKSYEKGGTFRCYIEDKVEKEVDDTIYNTIKKHINEYIKKHCNIKEIVKGEALNEFTYNFMFESILTPEMVSKKKFDTLTWGKGRHRRHGVFMDRRYVQVTEIKKIGK